MYQCTVQYVYVYNIYIYLLHYTYLSIDCFIYLSPYILIQIINQNYLSYIIYIKIPSFQDS